MKYISKVTIKYILKKIIHTTHTVTDFLQKKGSKKYITLFQKQTAAEA